MGMDRYTKQLHHQKSQKITTGTGEPSVDSGGNGSISIRDVNGQIVLFAKYNGDWYSRDLGHNTRMGEKHLTHLSIDDSGIHAMDGFVSLAHFGQTLRIGEDSSSKSALRVASDGSITIGTSSANNVTIAANGNLTLTGEVNATSGTFNGSIAIGSSNSIFKADGNGIYLGNATFASAPFRVTPAGAVTASNMTVTGGNWSGNFSGATWDGNVIPPSVLDATKVFSQDGIPTSTSIDDIWFDTDDNNHPYIAESVGANEITAGEWVSMRDGTIAGAQNTADNKNTTFYQDDAPSATKAGDLWFDTNDNHKMYRATGTGTGNWSQAVTNAANITAGTIDTARLNTSEIQAATVTSGAVNALTITANAIDLSSATVSGTLAAARIAAGSLNADKIEAGTITSTQINTANITSAVVTSAAVNAHTITADVINMDTCSISGTLAVGNTDAKCTDPNADNTSANETYSNGSEVRAGTGWSHSSDATKIDGGDIYANSVTATQINVANLAAINADMGSVTAGTLTTDSINFTGGSATISFNNSANAHNSSDNVIIGYGAYPTTSTGGDGNVAIGRDALAANNSGAYNICIGYKAGDSIAPGVSAPAGDGDENILIGKEAGQNITTGHGNVIIGGVDAATVGGDKTLTISSGDGTVNWLKGNSSGTIFPSGNISMGDQKYITFKSTDTKITTTAGEESLVFYADDDMRFYPDDDFVVYAGNQTSLSFSLMSDGKIYMPHFHNDQGVAGNLSLGTGGFMYVGTSDARHKNVITTSFDGLSLVNKLTPTYFTWKDDYQYRNGQDLGFIAQEVYFAIPEAVRGDVDNGDILSLGNKAIMAALTKAVQELSAKVTALEAKVG
tara:strand:- start:5761 stop:8313 length:2553 start_codon:yes stop_codon:yes gene_type:complete